MVLARRDEDDDDDDDDDDDENDESPEFVLHGNLCCASSIEDEIAAQRFLNNRNEEATLAARLSNGSLLGQFEFRKRDYVFRLAPSSEYREPLTLQSLAGVYTQTVTPGSGDPVTLTMSITTNGQVTGSHSNGCVLNGNAAIPSADRNMVRLNVELANCGGNASSRQWNGAYSGLGVLLRNAVSPNNDSIRADVLYHSVVGPTWLGPQSVGR